MRLRLNSGIKLDIRLDIDSDGGQDIRVAPLLFITLIENVFKHGIHTPEVPLTIHILAAGNRIECHTSNGYIPSDKSPEHNALSPSGGIGMVNLRRRLHLIYGPAAELKVSTADGLYQVWLSIPSTLK